MRTRLIFILCLMINFAFSQNSEKNKIPQGVVYNYCSDDLNNEAIKNIKSSLEQKDNFSIIQANLTVGNQLWSRFRNIETLKATKTGKNVIFRIDKIEVEGKMYQNTEDSKLVWDQLRKEITGNYVIRKANEVELKYYWSTIAFDIEEPLFILETQKHNYILNLSKNDLKLFWLDELPVNLIYYNPIEKNKYIADSGFKTYRNGKEVSKDSIQEKDTKLEKVVFLSSNQDLEENSSLEDLKLVVDKTNSFFEKLFKDSQKSGKIMVQFELGKQKNIIKFAVRDDLDLDIMKEFESMVNSEKYPNTRKKEIKLQLIYKVNSYSDTE
jgi:hypothetical protein